MASLKSLIALDTGNHVLAVNAPAYVNARSLAANTPEDITVPAGARFVRLSGTTTFYANFYAASAVPGADIADGTGSIQHLLGSPEGYICVVGVTTISVVAGGNCIVTASFYK